MKLLIFATPRSGSSAFQTAMTEAHGLEWISEPFNYELHQKWEGNDSREHLYQYKTDPYNVPDGFCIKSLTFFNHWPNKYGNHWRGGLETYMQAYKSAEYQKLKVQSYLKYMDQFDRTFLLLRRDVGDQLRSMLIGMQKERHAGRSLVNHWNQAYDGFDPILDDEGALNTLLLFDSIKIIERLSALRKIPILFYEDLYNSKDIFDRTNHKYDLGLDGTWEKHFDPDKRWRKLQK